ncbi:MAG: AI-2E family transporter [Rhodospirillaceae bacterium]|nr:AI-2E family transporter [Rhodospirillaceae bacterium]
MWTTADPLLQTPPGEIAGDRWIDAASLIIAGLTLVGVLKLGLLSALLSGLLIYLVVQSAIPVFRVLGLTRRVGKTLALVLFATTIVVALALGVIKSITLLTAGSDNLGALLQQMADVISTARERTPVWAQEYFPSSTQELESAAAVWLREHAGQVGVLGQDFGKFLFHTVLGMIIGGIVAFYRGLGDGDARPLARALGARASVMSGAFRNVVFSQVRISALNTTLTAIYLAGVLPLFNVDLPLVKTMIAVTFLVSLIPILGNLISNTMIVIVSLSVSPYVALGSLAFLVVIHKLEYFVNARIIGARIRARAWELLMAMLVMEAAFGIPGLIAAPIYYAYLKDELTARRLI